ncbi:class I SAM-dependent methyltransferase [bacterium]|nr:class I SAM-dependent methyltransferase [bacterium]NUN46942.1 class I SAM-dependent methyltransferase [bacterium]HMW34338.1 class I SAM-dependent methyltransferase [bacterium]HMY36205.1 class I SAM-dependent methyltransferase [bacterium]HMZ05341.1 class I SAM-dependent methyltransferase [bacterium]
MSASTAYPEFVARFYDTVYAKIRTSIDHDFYVEETTRAQGSVLEVGVGTGRLFMEALRAGADIYGLDASATMIRTLQAKLDAKEKQRVSVADVRDFTMDRRFALIVAPFRVFTHLRTVDEQLAALACIKDHLEPGGTLILDVFNPDPVLCSQGRESTLDFDGEWAPGQRLKRFTTVVPDFMHQINHVTMRYVWDENGTTHDESWSFRVRYYFRFELEHLIYRSGLALETMYGGFDRTAFDENSKELIAVCKSN